VERPVDFLKYATYSAALRLVNRTFTFQGRRYRYLHHRHNFTSLNERTVEVPIFADILREASGQRVLEIGNVLAYYLDDTNHVVVDKYERSPGVINEDVVDYRPGEPFDLILSISTLEHVGWDEDERDPAKIPRAIDHLRGLLSDGGRMVVSLPTGYNSDLDEILREDRLAFRHRWSLRRVSRTNRWVEAGWQEVKDLAYDEPYMAANGMVILEFGPV
jgi:hypothetical protein